jgi:hypothetical protein
MHTIFTHSKDLPEDIFKAVAQLVFRLLSCRHFFSQSALRFFYLALPNTCEALLQCTPYLHIARTCLRTSLKQVHSLFSDSSVVVTYFFSQSALRLFYPALPNTCEALVAMHNVFTHSKDMPEDIFKAGAQFVFRLLCCRHLLSSVSQYFGCSILRYQTFARPLLQCISCLHVARTCLGTSLKQVQNFSSYST